MAAWFGVILLSFLSMAESASEPSASSQALNPFSQCGKEQTDKKKWNYCIYRFPGHSKKVVYYFHGINGDEREWEQNSSKAMLARWDETHMAPPIIVTLSFGKSWFLAEKNSSVLSGLFEIVGLKILPYIQTHLLGIIPEENILFGLSMGGFNGSQLYFKLPFLFSRAALICPAMATVSPHASKEEVDAYIQRTGADRLYVLFALALSRIYFPTEAEWQKHSPISLAQSLLSPLSPPIYISNGLNDEFGFQEGNIAFVDIAQKNGAQITSIFQNGGHCNVDLNRIADFLVEYVEDVFALAITNN